MEQIRRVSSLKSRVRQGEGREGDVPWVWLALIFSGSFGFAVSYA